MSYVIVTDTACNLPKELTDQYDIQVIDLALTVDGKKWTLKNYSMQDVEQIKALYQKLREGESTFRTSPANKQNAIDVMSDIAEQGNDILYIGFSSGLSDTYATIKAAAAEVSELYPERKIKTVDSLAASLGEGLLVYRAALLREAGKSFEAVAAWADQTRRKVNQWFTVDDMSFLLDSGRADGKLRFSGKFGRKAILRVNEIGRIVPVKDVRKRKKAIQLLVDRVAKTIIDPDHATVFIAHGDCIEDAQVMSRKIRERVNPHECLIHYIDPILGAAVGPDALGVFFIGEMR